MPSLKSRERVGMALRHQKPDRPPYNFWMDRYLMAQYEARYGPYFRVTHFGADVLESFPALNWPSGPTVVRQGMVWHKTPLLDDLRDMLAPSFAWPDPTDDAVYDAIRADREQLPDVAIFVDVFGPFTILHDIRLLQNVFCDIYDCPDVLAQVVGRIADICAEVTRRVVQLDIDAVYLMDDLCSNIAPLFSPADIHKYIFSCYERPIQIAHDAGLPVLMHSDGYVMGILDDVVALGFDGVNPLQPHLNDVSEFAARYGGRLCLYGGLESYRLIPDGSPDDVRQHVRETYHTVGQHGGLIYSSHDLPVHTPEENLDALVAAIDELGAP